MAAELHNIADARRKSRTPEPLAAEPPFDRRQLISPEARQARCTRLLDHAIRETLQDLDCATLIRMLQARLRSLEAMERASGQ